MRVQSFYAIQPNVRHGDYHEVVHCTVLLSGDESPGPLQTYLDGYAFLAADKNVFVESVVYSRDGPKRLLTTGYVKSGSFETIAEEIFLNHDELGGAPRLLFFVMHFFDMVNEAAHDEYYFMCEQNIQHTEPVHDTYKFMEHRYDTLMKLPLTTLQ